MADKAISELVSAEKITATDMFVLEQNGTAKKLTGQILLNWLTAAADGHGGIQSIVKRSTSGLADTYRITLADTTVFDFVVTNGRGISSLQKTGTSGLVDTYTFTYNDGTKETFTVTNGQKGDKGDNAYIWVKYASQEPTAGSHSFGDVPDAWIGVYWGTESTAPGDWQAYHWYQWKGEKGDKGDPATLLNSNVAYQVGDSGTVIPSGSWQSSVPVVPQGKYMWTRTTNTFNTGDPVVSYSVSRTGLDGSGSVSSVANISPDENGNVPLTASDVGALSSAGGDLTGELRMNGHLIKGLNMPTANDQAANMGFVHQQVRKAAPRNLLDNSDFRNPVNQRGQNSYTGSANYSIDRWMLQYITTISIMDGFIRLVGNYNFWQLVSTALKAGKTYTCVARVKPSEGSRRIYFYAEQFNGARLGGADTLASDWVTLFFSFTLEKDYDDVVIQFNNSNDTSAATDIEWVALYEGEYTTENLPEYKPKGYDAELLACQRQLQRFRTETERKTYCEDFRPTMRMTDNGVVSKFEQEIDGITYYFASAEL